MTTTADGVVEIVKFCDKSCIGLDEAGNGRSSLSEPMKYDFFGNSNRGFHYSRNSVLKIYFYENMCLVK